MEKLFTETEIRRMLNESGVTQTDLFIKGMQPTEIDDKSNQLLLQTSATILAGIIANEGVSHTPETLEVDVLNSLHYTKLLIEKIDTYAK